MGRRKIAGIAACTFGILLVITLLMYIYAVIHQEGENPLTVQPEPLIENPPLLADQGEQDESEASAEENEWSGDAEDEMTAVCELVRAMDFTVEQPHMELTEEEDRAYREAFLRLLKNELPIKGWYEGEDCYEKLWWAGIPYEELLEERDSAGFPYSYYYDDIDGDGKPEFGVDQQAVYFFDYELGEEACSISYCGLSIYFEGVLGIGKMWEHDCQHAWVERFRYTVLDSNGEWEQVFALELYFDRDEEGTDYTKFYYINDVRIEKEIWEELTEPFFEAIEYEIPTKTLTEVFGDLLEAE